MKRYILTDKQLSDRDSAVMEWVKHRILEGMYSEKLDQIYEKAMADSKKHEVPSWATHFYAKRVNSITGQEVDLLEEIPK
jgi:hypothetical protein